ncbi:MAG: barstar family protein [Polyangiaceae bacterium]
MTIDLNDSGIQVVAMDASTVTDACWAFEREQVHRVVRFVRGAKMADVTGVFDQFGAALQFPYYFGENWPAFSECIQDLSWLPASHYLLVVLDAQNVLRGSDDAFCALTKILRDCCQKWPLGFDLDQPWARKAAKFQVLLQTDAEHIDALTLRLAADDRHSG